MGAGEFWRSTPRIVNLVIEGYLRRRAWDAFHSGYGIHCKGAEMADLLGKDRKPEAEPMTEDQMVQNIRRWRIATGSRTAERTPPDVE